MGLTIGDSFSHFPNQYRYIYIGKWESGENPYRTRAYTFPTEWESGKVGKWEKPLEALYHKGYTLIPHFPIFPNKWESGKVKGVFGKVGKWESTCIPVSYMIHYRHREEMRLLTNWVFF